MSLETHRLLSSHWCRCFIARLDWSHQWVLSGASSSRRRTCWASGAIGAQTAGGSIHGPCARDPRCSVHGLHARSRDADSWSVAPNRLCGIQDPWVCALSMFFLLFGFPMRIHHLGNLWEPPNYRDLYEYVLSFWMFFFWGGITSNPRISWFMIGFALGFYWMVYVATPQADAAAQLQLALSLSCHAGVLLALFPQAGCYIIGAGATALAIHLVHESTLAANGANSLAIHVVHARSDVAHASSWLAVLDVAGGALGGYLCNRFRKPALDFVFSLAGSAVMVLMMHWWLNEAFHWCFGPDDSNSSPFQYWLALWSLGGPWNSVVRWWFSFSWLVFFYLGQRLRQRLDITEAERQHRRMQEQLRRAPNDCDRMPWNGSSHGRDGRGPQLPLPATMGSESRPPEEEDFGMYLLPEDLETMKRSKSIPCFTPESRPKIIPLRQTTSLPEPSAPPAPGSTRKPPARRVTLAGRPKWRWPGRVAEAQFPEFPSDFTWKILKHRSCLRIQREKKI